MTKQVALICDEIQAIDAYGHTVATVHVLSSLAFPGQFAPFSHWRVLICTPLPHVTGHACHWPQLPHASEKL